MALNILAEGAELLRDWKLSMEASRLSWHTIDSYTRGVRYYLEWCEGREDTTDPLSKPALQRWVTHILSSGAGPATARIRQQAVRRFAAWLAAEGEVDQDPFLGMKPPKLDTKVVESLTEDDIHLLLKACAGNDFLAKRDAAVVRLLLEAGLRAREVLSLSVTDVDLDRGLVTVQRGKGGKGRVVAIGAQTSAALARYIRARRLHRLASTPALWLGGGEQTLGYHGLRVALMHRAQLAGIKGFHLHKMRHTFASRWLGNGGSEGGLMQAAGWSSRQMVDRYSRGTAAERAQAEARRLNLGDL